MEVLNVKNENFQFAFTVDYDAKGMVELEM